MNKNDMELIKRMNGFIKNQEKRCECKNRNNVNDAVDAFNYLTELFPKLKNVEWDEMDRLRTKKALDTITVSNPIFDEKEYAKYFDPTETKWVSDVTKKEVNCADFSRNANILYSQLCLVVQMLNSILSINDKISQDIWENITRNMIKAYNYAAEGTDYYMDVNNEK